jgi:hypothetical protein
VAYQFTYEEDGEDEIENEAQDLKAAEARSICKECSS